MPAAPEAKVRVLVFGPAARAVEAASVQVRVAPQPTAATVMRALGAQHPKLAFALANARLAVNHAIAAADAPVREADEVALIALVDGG